MVLNKYEEYEDYKKFESSESQGKTLHTILKKYPYTQSKDTLDVSPLVEQINEIKNNL